MIVLCIQLLEGTSACQSARLVLFDLTSDLCVLDEIAVPGILSPDLLATHHTSSVQHVLSVVNLSL